MVVLKKHRVFRADDTDGTQYHQYLLVGYSVHTKSFGLTILLILNSTKYLGVSILEGTGAILRSIYLTYCRILGIWCSDNKCEDTCTCIFVVVHYG